MAFFKKIRPLISVIKYEGPQDVFVWKHEDEDFNTKTQLIVNESQEAIFFKNGQANGPLPAGRYTLDTQNIPFLRAIICLATGPDSPFHCQVYFINKAVSMGISWGTAAPIPMIDPMYGVPIKIKGNGDFSLRVLDSNKLVIKLVGSVKEYTQKSIKTYFSEILAAHIRDTIANTMIANQISGWNVSTQLLKLSKLIKEQLDVYFADFGLELVHFVVSELHVDGLERVGNVLEQSTLDTMQASGKANVQRIQLGVKAEEMQTLGSVENEMARQRGLINAEINQAQGITEARKAAFRRAEKLAANVGTSQVVQAGGVGIPFSGGNQVYVAQQSPAAAAVDIVKTAMSQSGFFQQNPPQGSSAASTAEADSRILPETAGNPAQPAEDADQAAGVLGDGKKELRRKALQELKEYFEDGLITEEEYAAKKKEILG